MLSVRACWSTSTRSSTVRSHSPNSNRHILCIAVPSYEALSTAAT